MQKNINSLATWFIYELKYVLRNKKYKVKDSVYHYFTGNFPERDITKYVGQKVLTVEETNCMLYDKIMEGKPYWAGRYGGNELSMVIQTIKSQLMPFRVDARADVLNDLCQNAGFFPNEINESKRFVDLMLEATKDIDLVGVWNLYMEEWILKQYANKISITRLTRLEPWYLEGCKGNIKPWSAALKGKKVLVIHPFAKSIEKQYKDNREGIFSDLSVKEILPEFDLITLKAVQTIGNETGGYDNWFSALESMISECKKIQFDVAIIGCGAYGFPLAYEVKKMGKIAIHLGGATQLLFGIRGKRWENSYTDVCDKMMNEYWVRPLIEETISEKEKIENGCYW